MSNVNPDSLKSFVEFEEEPPLRLIEGSAASLKARLATEHNFGGLAVHGVGWNISDHLPDGLIGEDLEETSGRLAEQLGNRCVSGSIRQEYKRRQEAPSMDGNSH